MVRAMSSVEPGLSPANTSVANTPADDPYLPAAVPSDNAPPPKKSRAWLGWTVLIGGLTMFYAYSGSGPHPERVAEAQAQPSAWSMAWTWLPLVLFAVAAFWFYRQLRGSSSYQEKTNPALLALADHDFERALALFEALLPAYGSTACRAARGKSRAPSRGKRARGGLARVVHLAATTAHARVRAERRRGHPGYLAAANLTLNVGTKPL